MCPRHCPEEFKKPKERKIKGRSALKKQVIYIQSAAALNLTAYRERRGP
jgi:hypothetical protein